MAVYLIRAGETGPVKIGKADDPEKRLQELQVGNHETLRLIRVFEGSEPEEMALMERFEALHIRGSWYAFSRDMMGDVGLVEVGIAPNAPDPPNHVSADADQEAQRESVRQMLDRSKLDATGLARRAGVAHTTVTRFLNADVTHLLSARTLTKLQRASEAEAA